MTRILAKQNITQTVGHQAEFCLACTHASIHFSLTFDFLKQAMSRAFLNVVVIGFAPVVTAQLTSTIRSLCSDLGTVNSKNAAENKLVC